MSRMIFVNLPVQDLDASVDFFTRLGFTFNQQFTDENATCMVVSDQACVMLLVRPFFGTFTTKDVADAADRDRGDPGGLRGEPRGGRHPRRPGARRGGSPTKEPQDEGYMYGRSFYDLDGHAWEVMWMDPPPSSEAAKFSHPQHQRSTGGTWPGHPGGARSHLPRRQPCCSACVRRWPTVPGRWRPWPGTAASRASTSSACRSSPASRASPTSWCSGRRTRWGLVDVAELVEEAGGTQVTVGTLHRARPRGRPDPVPPRPPPARARPGQLPEVLGRLLDATPTSPAGRRAQRRQDTLTVAVGPHQVVLRRTAPFTATEHARAVAFAEVASELRHARSRRTTTRRPSRPRRRLGRLPTVRLATFDDTASLVRMHARCSADSVYRRYATPLARIDDRFARRLLLAGNGALVATVGDEVVGIASISTCENAIAEVSLLVEDGWQRRGLGTRLLSGGGPAGPRARRRRRGAAQPHPQPGADVAGVRLRAAGPDQARRGHGRRHRRGGRPQAAHHGAGRSGAAGSGQPTPA